jgi:quercetin dioxygenase-like cupin family protein
MRLVVLSVVVLIGGACVAWNGAEAQGTQAAAPAAPDPANFTGKVTPHPTTDIRLLRYSFEPGARTNWHSHEGGQVIVVEQGRMRVQERGGRGREFAPRETYVVAANVEHWHGALPGEPLTQVALSYGATRWMKPVTDAEYQAAARK